ncbi:putative disease resistance RPP13-like protein 3 [Camellia sinensis]|uniref:putative disease resistance RPP13-like protein 3 n=1 Tax=Camellia sinensis TaxID=4442 RepID=UPI001036EF3D|nr:putative disease resistance RPP13-like protein 3 [Camellia sinensis]
MDGIATDSVLKELKQLINSEDNLIANESHQIQSLYYDLRFLGAILKDMREKQLHEQNDETENLAMQTSCVTYETGEIISSFAANVVRQRYNNKGKKIGFVFDFRLNLSNIMEQIKPIEVKVMQFYDKVYQIEVLQDGKSSDGVPSMENKTMVEEEITVGFDDEALTVKEQLAGEKKQLHIMSIVGKPRLLPKNREMLLDILHSVNLLTNEVTNMSNEMLGENLYKHFKGKRYVIVIDDIWDIGAQVDLKMYLPNDNNGSRKSLEEVVEGYLIDLVHRSLVIVARKKFDGRIKACRMHDLLHDLCLKKAREINFLHWIHNSEDAYPPSSDYRANNQCFMCIHSDFLEQFDHVACESYSPAVVQSVLCFNND